MVQNLERGKQMNRMWIDNEARIISFHEIESGTVFEAEKSVFWNKVALLMGMMYKVQ